MSDFVLKQYKNREHWNKIKTIDGYFISLNQSGSIKVIITPLGDEACIHINSVLHEQSKDAREFYDFIMKGFDYE